ncbi:hypothetical protein BDP27DRAFT_1341654 [Rhodocollybia butyracea]|uniref:Secreted protein n=1 Tax=Rhodocollybia butyracea TaxID=206335 RepID=A0A9P5PAP6_9AGAR|nr:hypothetical protein BDP27DRAFT_1341654 [Rhodocollybia butyracea]
MIYLCKTAHLTLLLLTICHSNHFSSHLQFNLKGMSKKGIGVKVKVKVSIILLSLYLVDRSIAVLSNLWKVNQWLRCTLCMFIKS